MITWLYGFKTKIKRPLLDTHLLGCSYLPIYLELRLHNSKFDGFCKKLHSNEINRHGGLVCETILFWVGPAAHAVKQISQKLRIFHTLSKINKCILSHQSLGDF